MRDFFVPFDLLRSGTTPASIQLYGLKDPRLGNTWRGLNMNFSQAFLVSLSLWGGGQAVVVVMTNAVVLPARNGGSNCHVTSSFAFTEYTMPD